MNYEARVDRNFARACEALSSLWRQPTKRGFPVSEKPAQWCRSYDEVFLARRVLERTAVRVAYRWLRARGDDQARALAERPIAVKTTSDGRLSVHVHAYSRSAQRRARALAVGLARRVAKTLRAAAAGPELGVWQVVVSWGFDPAALAEQAGRKLLAERKPIARRAAERAQRDAKAAGADDRGARREYARVWASVLKAA